VPAGRAPGGVGCAVLPAGPSCSARRLPLLFTAGFIAGCGGYAGADASRASSGGDVSTDSSVSTGGDGVAAVGPVGSSGGDATATASGGSSGSASLLPINHRPEEVACPRERGPGHASVVRDCTQDSECTDGMNGRCISPNVLGPLGGSFCSYDTCFADADCPVNEPCECRESPTSSTPNFCVTGSNCRIDSDCGPGGFCSPSLFYVDSTVSGSPVSGQGFARSGYFSAIAPWAPRLSPRYPAARAAGSARPAGVSGTPLGP
jgi:hypothetical protein